MNKNTDVYPDIPMNMSSVSKKQIQNGEDPSQSVIGFGQLV